MSKYNHIKDGFIKKALEDYKGLIDLKKGHELSLSKYRVEKPWGYELWLELNEFYAYKLIHMKQGNRSSLQWHDKKIEANYVIEGEAEVLLEDDKGEIQSYTFKAGSGWVVPVRRKHRVIALTDYTALEVSTPHLDDVVRFQDDSGRQDGKIDSEHE